MKKALFGALALLLIPMLALAQAPSVNPTAVGAKVSTVAPSYVAGTVQPLSLDTTGGLRISGGGGGGGGGAVTIVDGGDSSQGAKADAVCSTDTGTCSNIALQKRANTTLTTMAGGMTPVVTSAAASGLVAKATGGNLYGFTASSTTTGWFLLFNATSCPADGAVAPVEAVSYTSANTTAGYSANPPLSFSTGLSVCFSTTGPFNKTASATAYISAKVK